MLFQWPSKYRSQLKEGEPYPDFTVETWKLNSLNRDWTFLSEEWPVSKWPYLPESSGMEIDGKYYLPDIKNRMLVWDVNLNDGWRVL